MLNSSMNIGSTPIKDLDRISGVNRAMNSAIPTIDRLDKPILELNIKDEKAKEKEKMLELINQRNNEVILPSGPLKDTKKISIEDSIDKLKTILSKRYNLEEDDYKILVDRYHIAQNGITKANLEEMLGYIKHMNQYSTIAKNTANQPVDNTLLIKEPSKPLNDIDKLDEERRIQLENIKKSMSQNKNKNENSTRETIVNRAEETIMPMPMHMSIAPSIIKNIPSSTIENRVIPKEINTNPLIFIVSLDHITSNKDGVYEVPLWIEDLDRLRGINKCKIVSLELDRDQYSKNMENLPYIFVDILECDGSIYINGTTKKLVDRIRLERLEKIYYGESNRYSTIKNEQLKKISIGFYNNKCELLLLEKGPITITIEFS